MKTRRRLLALFLTVVMVLSLLPVNALAGDDVAGGNGTGDSVVVIACSDFQDPKDQGNSAAPTGSQRVKNILSEIEEDHPEADGFICCGDYDKAMSSNISGNITTMKNAVNSVYENLRNFFLVQGNHDQCAQNTNNLSGPGAHDTDNYGVFIIDEDDYQWKGADEAGTRQTARELQAYFDDKDPAVDTEPIFVVSHVPLHYSARTYCDGDGAYAKYIFDVLQDAADEGFTIIFLHGHDHSQGLDNYLGGAVDYLPVGHQFYLAVPPVSNSKENRKNYTVETLKFTYMNAGYIGYYVDYEPGQANTSYVDDTLTMSVFTIEDDKVTVERYSEDGPYENLKSAGVHSPQHASDEATIHLNLFTDVITSPQTIALNEATEPMPGGSTKSHIGSYEYVSSVTAGEEYLLVSNGYALQNNNGTISAVAVEVNSDGTVSVPDSASESSLLWKFNENSDYTSSGAYTVENGGKLMGRESGNTEQTVKLLDAASAYGVWSYIDNGTHLQQISARDDTYVFYLYNRSGSFYINYINNISNDYTLKLYKKAESAPDEPDEPVEPEELLFKDNPTGITVRTTSGTGIVVTPASTTQTYAELKKYAAYDITVTDFVQGTDATVSIPLPAGYNAAKTAVYYRDQNGNLTGVDAVLENGKFVFSTNHFSEYIVGQTRIDNWVEVEIPGESTYTYTLDTDGVDVGENYLIVANSNAYALAGTSRQSVSINSNTIKLQTNGYQWTTTDPVYNTVYNSTSVSLNFSSNTTLNLSNPTNYYVLDNNGVYHQVTQATCTRSGQGWFHTYSWTVTYDGGSTTFNTQSITLYTAPSSALSGVAFKYGNNGYLYATSSYSNYNVSLRDNSFGWTVTSDNNGSYLVAANFNGFTRTLRYNSGWAFDTFPTNRVRLFKLTDTQIVTAETYYLGMDSDSPYVFPTSRFASQTELENYLKDQIVVCKADDANGANIEQVDFTLTGSANPGTVGTYSYTVSYDGHTVGTISVQIKAVTVTGIELLDNEGTVIKRAKGTAQTGAKIRVSYSDGTTEDVDVLLSMVSNGVEIAKNDGDYAGLTVSYEGQTAAGFTLHVLPDPRENDYPEYPDEGSVRVGKTGNGIDWYSTGVAEVELTTTGVPMNKGIDVIVMVDTSSSMTYGAREQSSGSASVGEQRIDYLRNSLTAMLNKFTAPNEDGSTPDVRLALADFNGYTSNGSSNGWPISNMDTIGDSTGNRQNKAQIFTGDNKIDAGAFEQVGGYTSSEIDTLVHKVQTLSGTNYDYAFDTIYRLAYAIREQNESEGEDRELYVIFMSDGCPYSFNYYRGGSGNGDGNRWGNYLTGSYTMDSLPSKKHSYFYNYDPQNGKYNTHRMADAIKGSPDEDFEVISPTNDLPGSTPSASGQDYMYTVKGLGIPMYAIAFCVYADNYVTADAIDTTISRLASDADHYFKVQGTEQDANVQARLDNAFTQISADIQEAATNARFVDTLGKDYDLQMATKNYRVKTGDNSYETRTLKPSIKVKEYEIYRRADVNGTSVTEDMIGSRKNSNGTLKEIVIFNTAGTQAYSNKVDVDRDGTYGAGTNSSGDYDITDQGDNILDSNGVINAQSFWYNTSTTNTVRIDTDGDGTTDYALDPETFYWKIGTIGEMEYALSYDVYLTGSMEGDGSRLSGIYPTNKQATLYYTNWLDHEAHKDTVSPRLPWGEAHVNYAFYLVDEDGDPIVNSSGDTGGFAYRIQVGETVDGGVIPLNGDKIGGAFTIAFGEGGNGRLPEGYELYDFGATYKIEIASNLVDNSWTITKDMDRATTYVTDYSGSDYSNSLYEDDMTYSYVNTTAWFAVLYEPRCVPDVVVVDYGLPVDINVLANDMFGKYGSVDSIGMYSPTNSYTEYRATLGSGYAKTLERAEGKLDFGTATVRTDGKIRYTPANMQMTDEDIFYYAAKYEKSNSQYNGYYYADVTVIPATIIYYEDTFVDFSGDWVDVTSDGYSATQAEDRPGIQAISGIDANNIYGYDAAYTDCTMYSNGAAKKVTVTTGDKPTATFTFTGTGFDIISLTSKATGTIKVKVYEGTKATGTAIRTWAVDTYYGYDSVSKDDFVKTVWFNEGGVWHVRSQEIVEEQTLADGEVDVTETGLPSGNDIVPFKNYVIFDENYEWVVAENDDNALYQIPVLKSYNDLPYGTYTVVVSPTYSKLFEHIEEDKPKDVYGDYDFYLDAVRVYGPADPDSDEYEDIVAAYKADNEAYPEFIEIRNQLIDPQDSFETDDAKITGAVFIDALAGEGNVFEYQQFGPNNEVYLENGQGIAFQITSENMAVPETIQISAKSVNAPTKILVQCGGKEKEITLASSTDCYYDITDVLNFSIVNRLETGTITITNEGSGIASLTNIKITHNQPPVAPMMLTMSRSSLMSTVNMLQARYAADISAPESEAPVVEEPAVFTPAKVNVKLPNGKIKVGDNVAVTISTSSDVASLTLNGVKAILKKTDKKTGEKTWTVSVKAAEVGKMRIAVVAYDAENTASEPIEELLTVAAKNGKGNNANGKK